MFVACGIWCFADVSSVSPSSEQTKFPYNRPGRPGFCKLRPNDRDDYMETPRRRPRTIEKDRCDRDRLDRKVSIRKTETIARERKCFNGNHFRATGTTQKYLTMHRTFPTVFQKWLRQQDFFFKKNKERFLDQLSAEIRDFWKKW